MYVPKINDEISPYKTMYSNVHRGTVEVETPQMSIEGRMNVEGEG